MDGDGGAERLRAAALDWCGAWNRRESDAVMAHYAEDVEFSSPTVVRRWRVADGWLHGRARLRANFAVGMRAPGLRFDLVEVLAGAGGAHAVLHRRETGALVVDLVEVDAHGLAWRVVARYGAAVVTPPAPTPP